MTAAAVTPHDENGGGAPFLVTSVMLGATGARIGV